ncbi:lycopene cyclase domain-containing protein [Brevibacterium paucivorans]|uniref:lycopene cyclase domain-containing protein n=1 Tax=Brevibacterium paucivorans TaxID=170994 RepID=UPI00321A19E6
MTYTLFNLFFLIPAVALLILARARTPGFSRTGFWVCLVGLVILTVIFDNLMIAAGLFFYANEHTLGIRLGLMPVEDLAYVVFTALALPALWELLGNRGNRAGTPNSTTARHERKGS